MITDLWNLLIVNPVLNALVFIYSIVGNYGVAILIFTVIIKILTLPFSLQQLKAFKAQAALQPKIEEIKKKYAKDPKAQQRAQMELYRKEGINPLSGCLPMLIPWPLFLAFYQAISSVMSTQPEQFMTLSEHIYASLAQYVPVKESFLWLNLARPDPYLILPVLSAATTWIQQKMMTMQSSDPQARSMSQTMSIMMPLFMGYITWQFASGLAVYWVAFNIVGIIQQYFTTGWGELRRYMPEPILRVLPGPAAVAAPVPAPAPVTPPTSATSQRGQPGGRARRQVPSADGTAAGSTRQDAGKLDTTDPKVIRQREKQRLSATYRASTGGQTAAQAPARKPRRKQPPQP